MIVSVGRRCGKTLDMYCQKYPSLSCREVMVMMKYVSAEKLDKALFQVSSFMSVEEYLNKFCSLSPNTICNELYEE